MFDYTTGIANLGRLNLPSCHERNIPGKVAQPASEMATILPPFLPHQPIFCLILIKYDAEKFV